jgi:hypothetical protein
MAKPAPTETVTEVAPASVTDSVAEGELVHITGGENHLALRQMIRRQAIEADLPENVQDGKDFIYDIMERILTAETVEDVFAQQEAGLISGQDFTDRPFFLRTDGISIRKSTKPGGLPFYAMLKVLEISTGEDLVINCGGTTFMAVLEALRQKNYFDPTPDRLSGAPVVLIAKPSPAGAYLLLLPYKMPAPSQRGGKK